MNEIDRIANFKNSESAEGPKMKITISGVDNPEDVLQKTIEIMNAIAQYAYSNNWPEDSEWPTILPTWFVESMTLKTSEDRDNDEHLWHFESWIESMYHRAWEWYSSSVKENELEIVLKLLNIPFVFEQFLYIFYAQGIPMSSIVSNDDVYGTTEH